MRSFSQATTLARSFIQGGGAARRRKWAERERKRVRVRSEVRRWSASGARTSADLIPTKRMLALGRRRPSGELTWPATTTTTRCVASAGRSRVADWGQSRAADGRARGANLIEQTAAKVKRLAAASIWRTNFSVAGGTLRRRRRRHANKRN